MKKTNSRSKSTSENRAKSGDILEDENSRGRIFSVKPHPRYYLIAMFRENGFIEERRYARNRKDGKLYLVEEPIPYEKGTPAHEIANKFLEGVGL